MRKIIFILWLSTICVNCFSQVIFEKGYIINNKNEKVECLIRNFDWKNNPKEIEYKLEENSQVLKESIRIINEFSIYNCSKYKKFSVEIDKSSEDLNNISLTRRPEFEKDTLFLQVLVEGNASLYKYEGKGLIRYFLEIDTSGLMQLVYKKYRIGNKISTNKDYRQQMLNYLKCNEQLKSKILVASYYKSDLIKIIEKYNQLTGNEYTSYNQKWSISFLNINLRPGINYSTLSIENPFSLYRDVNFGKYFSFRIGSEVELFMPFNKNTWSFILEPSYQYFKSEEQITNQKVSVNYRSVELPFGIRKYFFISSKNRIFVNCLYSLDFPINSYVDYEYSTDLHLNSHPNVVFGVGYNYNGKYCLEFRSGTNRDVLKEYMSWKSKYYVISVILGYNIF